MKKNFKRDNITFVMYKEWEEYFIMLSDEEAGRVIKNIFAYAKRGEESELESMGKMVFVMVKNQLERDGAKWEKVVETNAQNAKKGGRPRKKPKGFSENPKKPDKDKEKDKEKDNEEDKEMDKEKEDDEENKKEKNKIFASDKELKCAPFGGSSKNGGYSIDEITRINREYALKNNGYYP